MTIIVLLSFVAGIGIGIRFRILAVIVATLIAWLLLIAGGLLVDGDGLPGITAIVLSAVGLQAGYAGGLYLRTILPGSRRHDDDGTPSAGPS